MGFPLSVENSNQWVYTLSGLAKRFLLLTRSLTLKLYTIKGRIQNWDSDFTLCYFGEKETLEYLKTNYFEEAEHEMIGSAPFWRVRAKLEQERLSNDVLVIEANRLLDIFVPRGGFQTFPWIKQIVSLGDAMYKSRESRIEDVYGRKARQYQYHFKISSDKEAVSQFYHELYVPYITYKYRDISHIRSLEGLQSAVKSGFLLQVFDQDRWVAGSICARRGKIVRIIAGGLAPDYQYNIKRGAMSTCDYFLFKWAIEHGIETIDFLRSRAHSSDGLFEYKRKWGAYAVKDVWPHTSLWIFVPDDLPVPEILRKQLVWHKRRFIEIGKML